MAKTDFELYSKTRIYVYDLDTVLDKMVKYKKPRLGDKIGHLSYDLLTTITSANNYCISAEMPAQLKVEFLGLRIKYIKMYLASIEAIHILLRMCSDKRYLHDKPVARLMEQSVVMKRMATAWLKKTQDALANFYAQVD